MLKAFLIAIAVVVTTTFSMAVGAGVWILTSGVAHVEVTTPDVDLSLPVPTALADLGLLVARWTMPSSGGETLPCDPRELASLVESLGREVAGLPDGTLVEVESPTETVWIGKEGGRLEIDVDTPDAEVRVSLPSRSVRRLGRALGAWAAGPDS